MKTLFTLFQSINRFIFNTLTTNVMSENTACDCTANAVIAEMIALSSTNFTACLYK